MRPAVRSGGGFILSAGGILYAMNTLPARGAGGVVVGGVRFNKEVDKGHFLLLNGKHVIPSDS